MENLWGVRTVRRGTQVGSLRGLGLFTAAAALTVSGCATAKLGQAVELSANGTQASGKLLNAAQTVETAFHTSVKSDQFLRALQSSTVPSGSGCSLVIPGTPEPIATEPSGPPSDALKKTATALRARTQLAGALGKTYSGMNALASYDARGSVQAGLSSVFEATNAFRESQGLATVPSEISILVPAIGGAIAQNRQVSMLKQASAHLRTALAAYREALSVSRTGAVSVLQDEISERYSLQIALWRAANGWARIRPIM